MNNTVPYFYTHREVDLVVVEVQRTPPEFLAYKICECGFDVKIKNPPPLKLTKFPLL